MSSRVTIEEYDNHNIEADVKLDIDADVNPDIDL